MRSTPTTLKSALKSSVTLIPNEQARFKDVILRRQAEITEELQDLQGSTEAISPDVSIGRLSRLDSMQHQQIALANKRRLEDETSRLAEATRRIEAGTFGRCLICGHDIPAERLKIQPDAVACVACSGTRRT